MLQQDRFYVNVTLKSAESDFSAATVCQARLPMDLVCVLDISGSMTGSKMTCLKEASTIGNTLITAVIADISTS